MLPPAGTGANPGFANFAGFTAILIWASLALLSRVASLVPPLQVTALSFSVSAVLGLGFLMLRKELGVLRQPGVVWLHGVGGLFGYHALYFAALGLAPVAEANLLNYLWPLLIVLFSSVLLGLRLGVAHWIGLVLGGVGCGLLLARGARFGIQDRAVLGYMFALGAGVVWALYSVLSNRLSRVPSGAIAGFCAATAILAGIMHILFEATVTPDALAWLAIGAMGIGPVGAAFFLWDIGMKRGDPRLLGTLAYATPVLSTLLLGVAGYAALTPMLLVAAGLVAAGGLIASRG